MTPEQHTRSPESGDVLILTDGRHFVVESADQRSRGWWFTARAKDGSSLLQGNLELQWDVGARAWRPASQPATVAPPPLPPSMQRPSQPKAKQTD